MLINISTTSITLSNTLASCQNSSFEWLVLYSVSTGTKAEFAAPSPTRSRSILGMVKAITNAWAGPVVPKNLAIMQSRTKPRMRLKKVAPPMIPAAFVICLVSDIFLSD